MFRIPEKPAQLIETSPATQQHPLKLPTSMNTWIVYNGSRGLQSLQDHLDEFVTTFFPVHGDANLTGYFFGLLFRVEACRGPQVQIKRQTSGLELKDLHTHLERRTTTKDIALNAGVQLQLVHPPVHPPDKRCVHLEAGRQRVHVQSWKAHLLAGSLHKMAYLMNCSKFLKYIPDIHSHLLGCKIQSIASPTSPVSGQRNYLYLFITSSWCNILICLKHWGVP